MPYDPAMRLFLAIELPEPARRHLAGVQSVIAPALPKASRPAARNLHLTLKFLGDVPDAGVPALCDALREVRLDGPMTLSATRLECFPPRGPVRVIAAGLEEGGGVGRLPRLHAETEAACAGLGFPREGRPYRPHVTLARARIPVPASRRAPLEELTASAWPGPAFTAGEFCLIESRLKPTGAEYTVLARFPLRADSIL